ncbi:hypothetical protein PUN4_150058 [Paraburkholderia unamae]|nr:hypothetical protein PUN4_150058 [Paraburkholderia unamae]
MFKARKATPRTYLSANLIPAAGLNWQSMKSTQPVFRK